METLLETRIPGEQEFVFILFLSSIITIFTSFMILSNFVYFSTQPHLSVLIFHYNSGFTQDTEKMETLLETRIPGEQEFGFILFLSPIVKENFLFIIMYYLYLFSNPTTSTNSGLLLYSSFQPRYRKDRDIGRN